MAILSVKKKTIYYSSAQPCACFTLNVSTLSQLSLPILPRWAYTLLHCEGEVGLSPAFCPIILLNNWM